MTLWHEKGKRKPSGGLRNSVNAKTKRLYSKGGEFAATTMAGEQEVKVINGRGLTKKAKLRKASHANVTDPKTQKTQKMKIVWVHENAANRLYVRRNIITQGTLIEVEKEGNKAFAKVTSRPGQDGVVNALLTTAPIAKTPKATKTTRAKRTRAPKATEAKETAAAVPA